MARERQGTRNDLKQNIQELIPESEPAPQTRDIRARYPGAAPPTQVIPPRMGGTIYTWKSALVLWRICVTEPCLT